MKYFKKGYLAAIVVGSLTLLACAEVSSPAASKPATTPIEAKATEAPAETFHYVAGEYAQSPLTDEQLRAQLTDLQYYVTQQDGTERAFSNKYWDNKQDGIYVDVVSGEPLFSSTDKYKSGTGWPSFSKPLVAENIVEKEDNTLFMKRTEVRSKNADSHLGHVFADGPQPTGLRYCMNSAAMRFVPKSQLLAQGYGEYLYLFK